MNQKTEINEEILKNTTKCNKNFSCLSGNRNELCMVEYNVKDKIHFIKCTNTKFCSYKISFGYSYVCTCPTRKEIYNRYKL